MTTEAIALFWPFCIFIIMLFVMGFYCLLVTHNLIRALIGLELLIKAVTLLIVVAGYACNHIALAQALTITLIVIEVVVITVAMGIVLGLRVYNKSLDVRKVRNLKG